jgi:hypothetical protein
VIRLRLPWDRVASETSTAEEVREREGARAKRMNMARADDGALEDGIAEQASGRKSEPNGCTGCGGGLAVGG